MNTVSIQVAIELNRIDPNEILYKPKIDRMFQDFDFFEYILHLFKFTGLLNWLDIQGSWTFVLFPKTKGGRYYTINIGPHEVAFSILPSNNETPLHMILVDKLILDYKEIYKWVYSRNGEIKEDSYKTALPRSVSIMFYGSFKDMLEFLNLDGVRRALIAYWSEGLISLKERNVLSSYSKHHNWNAVALIHSELICRNS